MKKRNSIQNFGRHGTFDNG